MTVLPEGPAACIPPEGMLSPQEAGEGWRRHAARDAVFADAAFRTGRYGNSDIDHDIESIAETIFRHAKESL